MRLLVDDFIEETVLEGGDNVHLIYLHVLAKDSECKECLLYYRFGYSGEGLFVVNAVLLLVTMSYPAGVVLEYVAIAIYLQFEDPATGESYRAWWSVHQFLHLVLSKGVHFKCHGLKPVPRLIGPSIVDVVRQHRENPDHMIMRLRNE